MTRVSHHHAFQGLWEDQISEIQSISFMSHTGSKLTLTKWLPPSTRHPMKLKCYIHPVLCFIASSLPHDGASTSQSSSTRSKNAAWCISHPILVLVLFIPTPSPPSLSSRTLIWQVGSRRTVIAGELSYPTHFLKAIPLISGWRPWEP